MNAEVRRSSEAEESILALRPEFRYIIDMVEPGSHFVFDLGAESTQSIELVAAFEGEFGLDLDEEAALSVQTVSGAVDFLAQRLG